MAMKNVTEPSARQLIVLVVSRLLVGLGALLGLLVVAATLGLAVRIFITLAGL